MRHHQSITLWMASLLLIQLAGCAGPKGGVPPFTPPQGLIPLPGQFTMWTRLGLLVAVGGIGNSGFVFLPAPNLTSPTHPDALFTLYRDLQDPQHKYIMTANGYSVMAPGGGGRATSDAITIDLKGLPYGQYLSWAKFTFGKVHILDGDILGTSTIQTSNGNYVTVVGGRDAFHTDATTAREWEYFTVTKCGDLGSGWTYGLYNVGALTFTAPGGGGQTQGAIIGGPSPGAILSPPFNLNEERFTLIRQADGTYALRTSNGVNYVTAVGGGGHGVAADSTFHTDATQVQAWEKFTILDQGNCSYTIQTANGSFVGSSAKAGLNSFSVATNLNPSDPGSLVFWRLYMFDL